MKKKLILEVVKDEAKKRLSIRWKKESMTYAEMIGYLEIAKDKIKEKEETKRRIRTQKR
ncbi:MAG: hypothetical protein V1703_00365 [Candidatus Altiarchaeota archaeon]